jgi:hypothetical protein
VREVLSDLVVEAPVRNTSTGQHQRSVGRTQHRELVSEGIKLRVDNVSCIQTCCGLDLFMCVECAIGDAGAAQDAAAGAGAALVRKPQNTGVYKLQMYGQPQQPAARLVLTSE